MLDMINIFFYAFQNRFEHALNQVILLYENNHEHYLYIMLIEVLYVPPKKRLIES